MKPVPRPLRTTLTALVLALLLSACEPFSLMMLGVGASTGISHQLNGLAYRTFTAPLVRVKEATIAALRRMDIHVDSVEKTPTGEIMYARAADRKIEVEIEALTSATTRVRAVARKAALIVDSATAAEIINQTQMAMGV